MSRLVFHCKYGFLRLIEQVVIVVTEYVPLRSRHRRNNVPKIFVLCNLFYDLSIEMDFDYIAFAKAMTFVFNSLTIITFLAQNVCRPSNCFCKPSWLSDIKIRSSAHNKWATIVSDTQRPWVYDNLPNQADNSGIRWDWRFPLDLHRICRVLEHW